MCTQEFLDLIQRFGRVSYGMYSKSEELLEELRAKYESQFDNHIRIIETLGRLSTIAIVDIRRGYNPDNYILYHAVREGNIDIVCSLRDGSPGRTHPWCRDVNSCAARRGYIEIIRILTDGSFGQKYILDSFAAYNAVSGRQLETLRVLRDGSLGEKCPWDKKECLREARKYPEILHAIESGELD